MTTFPQPTEGFAPRPPSQTPQHLGFQAEIKFFSRNLNCLLVFRACSFHLTSPCPWQAAGKIYDTVLQVTGPILDNVVPKQQRSGEPSDTPGVSLSPKHIFDKPLPGLISQANSWKYGGFVHVQESSTVCTRIYTQRSYFIISVQTCP